MGKIAPRPWRSYTPSVRHAPALLVLAAGLAACANTPGGEAGDAQSEQQRMAVLFVERQASDSAGSTSHVGARFVQYAGIEAAVLPDLLGTPALPAAIGCVEQGESAVDTANGRAEARLLDVGTIEVRAGDRVLELEPRRFPDLWNVVSGVIYSTDDDLPLGTWRFSAPGNAQSRVGAFDVEARAPEDLANVTVAEQPLAPGAAVVVPRHGFAVRWTRGERDDSIVVAFEGTGAERPLRVVCVAHDEGSLEIDAAWADRVADLARTGATLAVHRVRARPFSAPSLDAAHVVFDLSIRGTARAE